MRKHKEGKMISEFGKELRKLRIERGEILKDMADKFHITSAYLSAIEWGKRPIPEKMILWLKEKYDLDESKVAQLEKARDRSLKELNIDFEGVPAEQREVAVKFARTFKDFTLEQTKELADFLNRTRRF